MLAVALAALTLVPVGDFASPTWAGSPAGDVHHVYVTEQAGRLRSITDGAVEAAPVLDVSALVDSGGERGLLSAAFANGRTYVYFTAKAAAAVSGTDGEIQVREYPGDRLLLAVRHSDAPNHNGGQLQIGPDGKLWLGTGDGGGSNNQYGHSQDTASLLGKLIRLDPAQPAPEVLARGLRNPWRFSFDPSGRIVIADVGQGQREEVDVGLAANYGWPCREGSLAYLTDPGCDGVATAAPVLERPHSGGVCSITGGYVVRDPGLPSLLGRYVYGDYCAPALRSADLADPATDAPVGLSVASLVSFGEDACGRVYTVSLDGPVSRLAEGDPTPCGDAAPEPTATPTPTPTATSVPERAPTAALSPPAVALDRRPCTVSSRITGLRSVARRRFLSVALRADEPCRATISARGYRVATASLTPGRRTVVTLRGRRRGAVAVRVQAVDGAGNVANATWRVHVIA